MQISLLRYTWLDQIEISFFKVFADRQIQIRKLINYQILKTYTKLEKERLVKFTEQSTGVMMAPSNNLHLKN